VLSCSQDSARKALERSHVRLCRFRDITRELLPCNCAVSNWYRDTVQVSSSHKRVVSVPKVRETCCVKCNIALVLLSDYSWTDRLVVHCNVLLESRLRKYELNYCSVRHHSSPAIFPSEKPSIRNSKSCISPLHLNIYLLLVLFYLSLSSLLSLLPSLLFEFERIPLLYHTERSAAG